MSPSYDPFANYTARTYCPDISSLVEGRHCERDVFAVPKPFSREVYLRKGSVELINPIASSEGRSYPLGDVRDLLSWRGDAREFIPNFQGRVGERLFSLILECFTARLVADAVAAGYKGARGEVLREEREYGVVGGDAVWWTEPYLLKFRRRTTFSLLQKTANETAHGSRRFRYRLKHIGLEMTEIDGLAELSIGGTDYLLIGEIKTRRNWSSDPWDLNKKPFRAPGSIEKRLFEPMRDLYPHHHFVYVAAANQTTLFQEAAEPAILTSESTTLVNRLRGAGVTPVFLPLPGAIDPNTLAKRFYRLLITTRVVVEALEQMLKGSVNLE